MSTPSFSPLGTGPFLPISGAELSAALARPTTPLIAPIQTSIRNPSNNNNLNAMLRTSVPSVPTVSATTVQAPPQPFAVRTSTQTTMTSSAGGFRISRLVMAIIVGVVVIVLLFTLSRMIWGCKKDADCDKHCPHHPNGGCRGQCRDGWCHTKTVECDNNKHQSWCPDKGRCINTKQELCRSSTNNAGPGQYSERRHHHHHRHQSVVRADEGVGFRPDALAPSALPTSDPPRIVAPTPKRALPSSLTATPTTGAAVSTRTRSHKDIHFELVDVNEQDVVVEKADPQFHSSDFGMANGFPASSMLQGVAAEEAFEMHDLKSVLGSTTSSNRL